MNYLLIVLLTLYFSEGIIPLGFFAKDNLARAGIKLDSTKEADIKQIIKK